MKDANGTIMKRRMSFPGTMLNRMVAQNYTNEQYLTLTDAERRTYETSRQNSILFEVDGPYRAMALPAAQQQGKTLKKRSSILFINNTLQVVDVIDVMWFAMQIRRV